VRTNGQVANLRQHLLGKTIFEHSERTKKEDLLSIGRKKNINPYVSASSSLESLVLS